VGSSPATVVDPSFRHPHVADNLETIIAAADPRQAKALLRLLIKDLRVNTRSEILPTYRVITPAVCALPSSVGAPGIEPGTSRV
jgi:hypothetical protein